MFMQVDIVTPRVFKLNYANNVYVNVRIIDNIV